MQNNENVKIKEMYREERPYEKCEQYGAENLTDAELLAVLLRTGTKGENSLRLAQKILHPETDRGGLVNLPQWTVEQLRQVRGIGKVKAIQIRCLAELARRMAKAEALEGLDFSSPNTIARYYMEDMRHRQKEVMKLLLLNTKARLIGASDISVGTVNATLVSPRELFLEALKKKDVEVILLWDRIDEWMMSELREFEGHGFVSATAADLELGDLADKEEEKAKEEAAKEAADDVARLKKVLGDRVKDVRVTNRLVDSPSCVVGDADQMMTPQMRRMLEAAGHALPEDSYTLEINPQHPLIKRAFAEKDEARFASWAEVIFDQALLADQGTLKDPAGFVKRLNALLIG